MSEIGHNGIGLVDNAGIIAGYRERIAYLEECVRRLQKYAAFESVGTLGGRAEDGVYVECKNCGECGLKTMRNYELLQRDIAERNGRIDL